MSVVFSGTNQGFFTATGNAVTLQIPSDLDYMWVYNYTALTAPGANTGAKFYWQRGMAQGTGVIETKTAVTGALAIAAMAAPAGFYLVNSSDQVPGPSVAVTQIDGSTPPIVNTGSTANLVDGDIVRIINVAGALQIGGMDFTIDNIIANTSFELAYMATIVTSGATTGFYRRIPFDPYFYPRNRYITKISQAVQAIVTLSVDHTFTVGQVIRFVVPSVQGSTVYYGMTELNGVQATIVAVGAADADGITNTITVDVDTTAFTAFAFPLTASGASTFAQVVPVGENTAQALSSSVNILGDATINQAYIGMKLPGGANSPGGAVSNVMYWVAGKSFNV